MLWGGILWHSNAVELKGQTNGRGEGVYNSGQQFNLPAIRFLLNMNSGICVTLEWSSSRKILKVYSLLDEIQH